MKKKTSISSAFASTLVLLVGCGGGGSDGPSSAPLISSAIESPAGQFQVNPSATWRPAGSDDQRRIGTVASIDLSVLSADVAQLAGRTLIARSLGRYTYNSIGLTAEVASFLFVDKGGVALLPGAATTATAAKLQSGCSNTDISDPFAGDVLIPSSSSVELVVPAGATAVWLSVDDCFFADNVQTADPLRVSIEIKP